ncbi:MAG: flavin reductase family protein [Anaerolineae bacterium]|nr:MAG: flavin reductase family protein [Anaerolineae bacterium]
MEYALESLSWQSCYKLLSGAVVPRPIGWVSTLDEAGRPNLAPFSFFTVVCAAPPTVLFCPMVRGSDGARKDTLRNVRATGEFVVNIVTETLLERMNLTSAELPAGESEFAFAGLTPIPSAVVRPLRVAESPIHLECRVQQVIEISDQPGGGSIVIGEVVHLHVDDALLAAEDKIDPQALHAVGRLGGPWYCRAEAEIPLKRPSLE